METAGGPPKPVLTPKQEAHMLGSLLGRGVNAKNPDPVHKMLGERFIKKHPEMTEEMLKAAAVSQKDQPEEEQ
ncbi:MAG: hypothetical protein V1917_04570 [Candidatus Gottesmanbacteria bacterium]